MRAPRTLAAAVLVVALGLSAGCTKNARVIDSGKGSALSHKDSGVDVQGLPLPPPGACKDGDRCIGVHGDSVDKVDLLFVVDNSNSMREEQQALLKQMPYLITALLTGDADQDGTPEFGPVHDLHLGVVSSDMGLVGISGVDGCSGFGSDGILQHTPEPGVTGCDSAYPPFIAYASGSSATPQEIAHDFTCIAALGTGGCGFEQPLEAALKALSPATSPAGTQPIKFLTDTMGKGGRGHGDSENDGFLRNDPAQGRSLIAVVALSDEDDGSAKDEHIFTPPKYLDPTDPLAAEPLNLRDFYNKKGLYPVSRYVDGLKALRQDAQDLVVFGAIVGVPPDLVDATAEAAGDAGTPDAFYAHMLADSRMQEKIDPESMMTPGSGNMVPSCDTAHGKAYPPRRFVETARGFGENSFVASICADDYQPAVRQLSEHIGKRLIPGCLDESFTRSGDDRIACELHVVLPHSGARCADLDGNASPIGKTAPSDGSAARAVCSLEQLAVHDQQLAVEPDALQTGWYYDDFSVAAKACGDAAQRVAIAGVAVPAGAELFLDCS